MLWIQEQQARARLPLIKVDGTRNPADLILVRSEIIKNFGIIGLVELEGRSERAAHLHSIKRSIDELVESGNAGHDPDSWEARGEQGVWIRRH